jgi:tetratricopeptide (TPR) repeat protein
LIDSGVLTRDELNGRWMAATAIENIALPDNLQALLLARIDRLEEADRRTLQLAAVIGRSFYYRVLKAIHETTTELDRHLWALLRVELIREAAREPELEYIFGHALTQEAAYHSILRKERQKFHLRVAQALEELFAERQEELVPLLAHHYFEAGDPRSLDYCVRAGDSAFRMYALQEAREHYEKALQSTNLAEMDAAVLEHIYSKWGRSLELMAEWEQALAVYEELESHGQKLANRHMELNALTARAVIRSTANRAFNATEGAQLQERALALAREIGDQEAEAKILWTMLLRSTMTGGDLQERIQYGEQSLALARRLNLQKQIAFTLHDMWFAYSGAGQWEELQAALEESKQIWSQSGNLPMLSENLTRTYFAQMATGDLEAAIATFEEAFRVAEQANNLDGRAISSSLVGRAYFERGDFEQAISVMAKSTAIGKPLNNLTTLTMTQADLGWAYGWLGMPERGIQLATQGHQAAQELFPAALDWTASTLIRLFLLTADLDKAEELLKNLGDFHEQSEKFGFLAPQWGGIALAKGEWGLASQKFDHTIAVMEDLVALLCERGVRLFYPEALYLLGKAKLASGAAEEAFDVLSQAHGEAERLGFTRILLPISLSLSGAAMAIGQREDGVRLHDQAARLAQDLVGKIGVPDLRRAFLNQHLATAGRQA